MKENKFPQDLCFVLFLPNEKKKFISPTRKKRAKKKKKKKKEQRQQKKTLWITRLNIVIETILVYTHSICFLEEMREQYSHWSCLVWTVFLQK